jgi:hypothetical protein
MYEQGLNQGYINGILVLSELINSTITKHPNINPLILKRIVVEKVTELLK